MAIDMVNVQFTLSNLREGPTSSRLNRFMVLANWEDHFPHVQVLSLTRLMLDHKPLS